MENGLWLENLISSVLFCRQPIVLCRVVAPRLCFAVYQFFIAVNRET